MRETAELLARKAKTREPAEGPLPPSIAAFLDGELEAGRAASGEKPSLIGASTRAEANALFGGLLC